MRRSLSSVLVLAMVAAIMLAGPPLRAVATPVATDAATYELYGRVFPDPHGCVTGQPGKSPYAKGNVCATQFIQFSELLPGLQFLESMFPEFMDVYEVGESVGIPTTSRERQRNKLYAVRVTDERASGAKKRFGFSLSIHGIERAGAEGGTRAIEDLVTWARSSPGMGLLDETLGAGRSAVTVGEALRGSEIWFFYPNPDGWVRGDVTAGGLMYQRFNGNGVDVNRDWPTVGYTFRGYTPASEPEVRAFTDLFASRKGGWVGTGDLHGMLDANAFTFTMMPAGQLDYARNKAVVSVARRIQEDAAPRLSWYLGIQPGNDSGSVPDVAQQWGTVWDTIDYTVTGGLGDWMGSPLGLDAYVAIDNEMWLSHLAPNNAFEPDLEQAHIDGNKGLIYAQIEGAFRASSRTFPLPGRMAYVDHGRRSTHPGSTASTDPNAGKQPQPDIRADVVSPTANGHEGDPNDPMFPFVVQGPGTGDYYNGGFTVRVTYQNVQGVSPADLVTAVHVERACQDDHDCPSGGWQIVNSHWNQGQLYAAAGHTVNVNSPLPGQYRIRFDDTPPGVHRIEIDFTSEQSWPDPGQLPYDATSVEFFADLAPYAPAGSISRLTPDEIIGGADLSSYDTVVLVNDPLPGWYDSTGSGAAQDPMSFTMVAPAPAPVTHALDVTQEFDVDGTKNNKSMIVAARWTVPSDYDLFLDIQMPSGGWLEVGSSTNGINTGETIALSNMFPGHYRVRLQNWAAAPQDVRVSITFSDKAELEPVRYPTTRTAEERDAFYAKLRSFVEAGGNLVLTDGAARALPHLGVGTPADVRPQVVYAPNVAFTADGRNDTYHDPLAKDVDQPGAAEGSGHRHQTQEPVPLGYAIQDADGGNKGHSFSWAVGPQAWADAGGRIVGMVGGGVTLGEIPRGAGRIRFVGGLLPDPEERYDHPFGLSSYALTYTGWQLFENLVQWTRPATPDLAIAPDDVQLSRQKIVGGDVVTITATVRNVGKADATNVAVRFTVDGQPIATDQVIASLAADGSGTAMATWVVKHEDGTHTLAVVADPANAIAESNEANNAVQATVTVRGNKVRNGSFEESSDGRTPDHWSSSGDTEYRERDAEGSRSVSAAGPTASWTSDAIAVEAGKTYGIAVDVAGGGTVAIQQISELGAVLGTLSGVTQFTAGTDVAQVKVVLTGGLSGIAIFDNVRMWEE